MLLGAGAETNARDQKGNTPLHFAASSGEHKLVEVLLAHGADPNAQNDEGKTPLAWAGREIEALLKQHGAEQ